MRTQINKKIERVFAWAVQVILNPTCKTFIWIPLACIVFISVIIGLSIEIKSVVDDEADKTSKGNISGGIA